MDKIIKLGDKKPRIVLFQGSSRDEASCAGQISKTFKVVKYVLDKWSFAIDFDLIDLSVSRARRSIVQPCKGCVSTSSYHCHWKCDCYTPLNRRRPDLLHDLDVYTKLEESDGFLVFSPIHWHAPTTQVKALFDRLVCANQTLTVEDAQELMGKGNTKKAEITGKLSKQGVADNLLKNHLEGKVAGFYIHGDAGADDYSVNEKPESFSKKEEDVWFSDPKSCIMPIVLQCKYSGIEVPDNLIEAFYTNVGISYYDANKDFWSNDIFFSKADLLIQNLLEYLQKQSPKNDNT